MLWRPRFETIAEGFIAWHEKHLEKVKNSLIELDAKASLSEGEFQLRGRADRIDVLKDGTLSIIDYKTTLNPSTGLVKSNDAPQLSLEAALASRGAFEGLPSTETSELLYVRLRPTDPLKVDTIPANDLAETAWEELSLMVENYAKESTPYLSKARIQKDSDYASDYDHLARVREWALAEDGSDT